MTQQRSDYSYPLDESLIATEPLSDRSASRLMHLPANGSPPRHLSMKDLPSLLRAGDILVVNNTRVIPARIKMRKATGGAVELLVVRPGPGRRALALAHASKPLRPGQELALPDGRTVRVVEKVPPDQWEVEFPDDTLAVLEAHGEVPLPPYMRRAPVEGDRHRYQTVFARHPGSSAAPTAGLHLDAQLLSEIRARGVDVAEVTLHVGPGTFLPVRVDNLDEHVMHQEYWRVSEETAQAIERARARGGRVVAVGTTSSRTLETAGVDGTVRAGEGWTQLFIRPPYRFRVVDVLLTNFHLPESTLLMLVSALAGRERILAAYEEAQRLRYRFFSYGDAMLVERVA
ncbi:MAG: tRNA preQ1(34) S-adenosylmethionine ribosyltransferase-isomerase QueA [Myxococcota bacterium]